MLNPYEALSKAKDLFFLKKKTVIWVGTESFSFQLQNEALLFISPGSKTSYTLKPIMGKKNYLRVGTAGLSTATHYWPGKH